MTLLELLVLMKKHVKLIVVFPVVCAFAAAAVSWLVLPNTYTSNVSMYVLTRANESASALTNSDLSASQMLTNDVAKLIKSDRIEGDTAAKLQMSSLHGYKIEVSSETTTRVITISVTGESAQAVAIVANALAETTDAVAREVMDVKSINVIDKAVEEPSPSGPPRAMYTAVAFLAGVFLAIAIVVLMDMLNTRVRNADELEELLGIPVIGRIPVIK